MKPNLKQLLLFAVVIGVLLLLILRWMGWLNSSSKNEPQKLSPKMTSQDGQQLPALEQNMIYPKDFKAPAFPIDPAMFPPASQSQNESKTEKKKDEPPPSL